MYDSVQSCVYANKEFGTVTTCGVNRITVFVVIVASDNIAEQVAFTPKDPRLDQTNHPWTERISKAGK